MGFHYIDLFHEQILNLTLKHALTDYALESVQLSYLFSKQTLKNVYH